MLPPNAPLDLLPGGAEYLFFENIAVAEAKFINAISSKFKEIKERFLKKYFLDCFQLIENETVEKRFIIENIYSKLIYVNGEFDI